MLSILLGFNLKIFADSMIKIDGSSTVYPITEAVAEEFQKVYKDIKVVVGISGTGGGMKKFTANQIDICNASRPIKSSEQKQARMNGIDYIELPVAYDGLTVVINKKNDFIDYLTVAELKKLWEPAAQNTITKWSQIRAGFPSEKIKLYGPGTDSGTFEYFTEAICGASGKSRGDYTPSEDDNVLVQGVAGDKYALGYFGLAYYEENMDKLKAVKIDNGKGPIAPTYETVQNGTYQPLSRPLFIYVNRSAADRDDVQKFVEFYLKNAKNIVKEVGYIALPDKVYELAMKKFQDKKTGSVFKGVKIGVSAEELLSK
ncbi:MAG: PstS family phosphate ABC transporter substrate-binding protein [Candidatus Goldbacteria bacterium]|nr:PstS family phosphate ABC transporter substrate-binding protein [Candidatus Goldiibacteriota bacterium]